MANRGFAARITGQTFFIEEPAANVTPADGQGFDAKAVEAVSFVINVIPGTQGTINVTLQEADTDVNASYAAIADANIEVPKGETVLPSSGVLAIAFGASRWKAYGYKGTKRFVRAIASGASGTPDHKLSVSVVASRRRHIGG